MKSRDQSAGIDSDLFGQQIIIPAISVGWASLITI